jgi:poly(3-hydroxybutyrate) depolymerase
MRVGFFFFACALAAVAATKPKVQKQSITSDGKERTYYLLLPDNITEPGPLILLLHGSGHVGMSLIDEWKDLAAREGIILAAPDSADHSRWSSPVDGPDFLHDVVEAVKAKYPVNAKRVYVFGHSAGAIFGLYMAVMESEYFAAVGVHAGALQEDSYRLMEQAPRKIPIAIWVGTRDSFFALDVVRGTRDALNARGFQAQLREMAGHDHNYYAVSREVNKAVWEFLRDKELTGDPKWQQYAK